MVEGYEIPVSESIERWTDVTLADGTTFRAKMNVVSAVKLVNRVDANGRPIYLINATPTVTMSHLGSEVSSDSSSQGHKE